MLVSKEAFVDNERNFIEDLLKKKRAVRERTGAFTQELDEREQALLLCKPREVKQVPNLPPPAPSGSMLESGSESFRKRVRENERGRERERERERQRENERESTRKREKESKREREQDTKHRHI